MIKLPFMCATAIHCPWLGAGPGVGVTGCADAEEKIGVQLKEDQTS